MIRRQGFKACLVAPTDCADRKHSDCLFSAFSMGYRFAQLEKLATQSGCAPVPRFPQPLHLETAVRTPLLTSFATRAALAKREFTRHLALLS